jgi:hypothetical protein
MRLRVRMHRPLPISSELGGVPVFEDAGGAWVAIARAEAEDIRTRYTLVMRRHGEIGPGWRIVMADRRVRVLARISEDADFLTLDCVTDFA